MKRGRTASFPIHLMALGTAIAVSCAPAGSQADDPKVLLETTKGQIVIKVFYSRVPTTCQNFLDLVSRGFYNGTTFHRVESWCIQGGDPTGTGRGNFVDPQTGQARFVPLEISPIYRHDRAGMVAMARSNDPNSASCQFYITKNAMPALNGQYAIFGGVVQGVDIVRSIQRGDRILSATVIQPGGGSSTPGATTYGSGGY